MASGLVEKVGLVEKIKSLASEIALREGCLLYDLEFLEAGSRTLRVYIDRDPNGASLDDCVNVSRGLNLALDVEDVIPGGKYDLEVSTPGLERKLTEIWHFERAKGQWVQVKYEGGEANRTIKGKVLEVSGNVVKIEEGSREVEIPFAQILKAKMIFSGADEKGPKKGPRKKKASSKKR